MRFLLVLLLVSCASWAPTRGASLRRIEASKLRNCVQYQCQFTKQCLQESAARCKALKLEATCGSDDLWTDAPVRCRM